MIGILGAAKYESILEGDAERSTVSARYVDVSFLNGRTRSISVRLSWCRNSSFAR